AAADASPGAEAAALVRQRYAFQLRRAEAAAANDDPAPASGRGATGRARSHGLTPPHGDADVVTSALTAQRQRLVALRADGTIGDAAFQRVEEELDWAELDWAQLLRHGA
ncbi:MAG TPA: hypothetical protein VGE07_04625, partial [Herpetosiphonaceae bacterium]